MKIVKNFRVDTPLAEIQKQGQKRTSVNSGIIMCVSVYAHSGSLEDTVLITEEKGATLLQSS